MPIGRPSQYSPVIIPAVKAAAHFGATVEEIAEYLGVSLACFKRWVVGYPELRAALKPERDHADSRIEDSLYRLGLAGNVTACIFWLKNRQPDKWRDVQAIDHNLGRYILSDAPMTEQQWIEARATETVDGTVDQTVVTDEPNEPSP